MSRRPGFPEGSPFTIDGPAFELVADGRHLSPDTMEPTGDGVWRDGDVEVRVLTSTGTDGSSEVVVEADGVEHVGEVCLLGGRLSPEPRAVHDHAWFDHWGMQRSTVLFVRAETEGLFAAYTNPFGEAEVDGDRIRLFYRPACDVVGTFRSDPLVMGVTRLEGRFRRREALRGRDIIRGQVAGYVRTLGRGLPTVLDVGEVTAVRAAVAARVEWAPARARSAHWDWGENLFRRDRGDQETFAIYERLAALCRQVGIEHVLLAPGRPGTIEAASGATMQGGGPWQDVMWLGAGVEVGHGEWSRAGCPPVAEELRAIVAGHGLAPIAYTNPQYLWLREKAWRVVLEDELDDPGTYRFTCLAVEDARTWLVETAVAFVAANGLGGLSFDFVYWHPCHATDHGHEPGIASRYAQWDGYRRLMAELRDALPEAWLEGLIGSMELLPWGGADLTHPHPNMGDNQPQWVPAWPDLSLDRAAANYQRRTGWWFRNLAFLPSYKVPGQIGHQANRLHFREVERGWDWVGARYNLLSAIASGPSSLSVCYLPCWDEDEWQAVRDRDAEFFARWIGFAREHAEVLSRLEDLYDEPRPGAVDGTIARTSDGTGFVFLTNPDFDARTAQVPLEDGQVLRELHPEDGRLWRSEVTVEPHTVAILELLDVSELALPALFGVAGRADVRNGAVTITSATGTPGATAKATVQTEDGEQHELTLSFTSDGVSPTLGPWRDELGREVALGELEGRIRVRTEWVPGDALPALLDRLAPPTRPRDDEVLDPWSDPSRLRLFPALLDPAAVAQRRLRVNGQEVELIPAYLGTYQDVSAESTGGNNLLGFSADLTERLRTADDLRRPWVVELELDLAWAGQLTGMHVAHLPRRTSGDFELV